MKTAQYFRDKAIQCRSWAAGLSDQNEQSARGMRALALEFHANAVAIDASEASARQIEPETLPSQAEAPSVKKPNGN